MIGEKRRMRSPGGAVKVALVEDSFRHEALFYSGEEGFLRGTVPFVTEALQDYLARRPKPKETR